MPSQLNRLEDNLRQMREKGKLWSEEVISTATTLAVNGRDSDLVLKTICQLIKDHGFARTGSYDSSHPLIHYGREIKLGLVYLISTSNKALTYFTDALIGDYADTPHVEWDAFCETYFSLNPHKALPEMRQQVRKIMRSEIGKRHSFYYGDEYRVIDIEAYYRALPGRSLFGR